MCNDSTKTKIVNDNHNADPTSFPTAHRQAALAALSRELDEIDELRAALDEKRRAYAAKLAPIEEVIEEIESRIADEAEALGVFDDEYECDCGCRDRDDGASYEDEDQDGNEDRHENKDDDGINDGPPSSSRRRERKAPGLVPLVFGALGVGCAVASLVARWIADEGKG